MLENNPIELQYMETMISSIPRRYKNHPKTLEELFKKLNNVLHQNLIKQL